MSMPVFVLDFDFEVSIACFLLPHQLEHELSNLWKRPMYHPISSYQPDNRKSVTIAIALPRTSLPKHKSTGKESRLSWSHGLWLTP
mmetsp:Transcript_15807/g.23305  ORF Transcript_15807/g.23305 Transcript_15807/m.23305 type:complete len:86 (-) Transcript_15807:1193-1450(-)